MERADKRNQELFAEKEKRLKERDQRIEELKAEIKELKSKLTRTPNKDKGNEGGTKS